ncbi:MAG: tetratricopeptide repeat protein, partial [Chloroflexota bacterium]
MELPGREFAALLTAAIREIKKRESKTIAIIQDELGYALDKTGGASIEYWRKGNLPSKTADLTQLARAIIERLPKDKAWLLHYCAVTNYPHTDELVEELFPTPQLPTDMIPEPTALPNGSHMPLRRNPFFVGRTWDLQALAKTLRDGMVTAVNEVQIAAAIGMGGMGKTQLASEFVHRYGQYFPGGVFWINFEEAEAVPAQIAECGGAGRLNLSPTFSERTLEEKVKLVINEWQKPISRLLIFDNCEEEALLDQWLPKTGGSRVLVTSRRATWDPILRIRTFSLDVLYAHESVSLLEQLSKAQDAEILGQIAHELGHLPLALHLAGKYLYQYRHFISPEAYLAELKNPDLLKHPSLQSGGISPTGHDQHVWRTFALSYDKLLENTKTDKVALDLLTGAAHFAPGEPIWNALLIKTLDGYESDPRIALKAQDGFLRLLELGLIEVEKNEIYRMHRLVASFVQTVAKARVEAIRDKVERVVFAEAAKINKEGYPVPLLAWHLHLRSVADLAKTRQDARGAYLCQEMGEHLRQAGDFRGAFSYFQAALAVWQQESERNQERIAHCLFKLGHLHRERGELEEAKPYLDEALAIREKLFSQADPRLSESYNEIGRWHYEKNDMKVAQENFQRAIEICQQALGATHRYTAEYLNNLGMCLYSLDNLEEALRALKKALVIRQQVLGGRHPETALSFNNVGFLLKAQDKLPEAQGYYEEALRIRELVLGQKHWETGQTYNNLGNILLAQNKLEDAEGYLAKSVEAFEATFGGLHPALAFPLRNLGVLWQRRRADQKARAYFERALQIREASLGQEHPLTAVSRTDLQPY